MVEKEDRLYAEPREQVEPFRFDGAVAEVFADMIERSVPGYRLVLEMIPHIARRHIRPGSRAYDLGCSLGDSTRALLDGLDHADTRVVAVDNSAEMLAACRDRLRAHPASGQVELRCEDLRATAVEDATVIVMNFTLQFIPPPERLPLLTRIASGMRPGGILILSEKVRTDDAGEQALSEALHEAFKRGRGYSELEIAQKRTALEEILVPDTLEQHLARLGAAGFGDARCWFQCLNFLSLIAVR